MTLQNRVDPSGRLCAVQSRGMLMGNRGILHNDRNEIIKPWAHKAWVTCLLEYKGIKRPKPFSKGSYSELFFLDEATAFAAGHRPCAYCQRARHLAFKASWVRANVPEEMRASTSIPDVDKILHSERTAPHGAKKTFDATLVELPLGTIFEHEGSTYLVAEAGYLPWSFAGYGPLRAIDHTRVVQVLTPPSTVRIFTQGFVPSVHVSAGTYL